MKNEVVYSPIQSTPNENELIENSANKANELRKEIENSTNKTNELPKAIENSTNKASKIKKFLKKTGEVLDEVLQLPLALNARITGKPTKYQRLKQDREIKR